MEAGDVPSRLPAVRGEFGPFDVLSDWAHALYVAGSPRRPSARARRRSSWWSRRATVHTAAYLR